MSPERRLRKLSWSCIPRIQKNKNKKTDSFTIMCVEEAPLEIMNGINTDRRLLTSLHEESDLTVAQRAMAHWESRSSVWVIFDNIDIFTLLYFRVSLIYIIHLLREFTTGVLDGTRYESNGREPLMRFKVHAATPLGRTLVLVSSWKMLRCRWEASGRESITCNCNSKGCTVFCACKVRIKSVN